MQFRFKIAAPNEEPSFSEWVDESELGGHTNAVAVAKELRQECPEAALSIERRAVKEE